MVSSGDKPCVRTENRHSPIPKSSFHYTQQTTLCYVPEPRCSVFVRRDNQISFWAKGYIAHFIGCRQRVKLFAGCHIPDLDCGIAGGDGDLAIVTQGDSPYSVKDGRVGRDGTNQPAISNIPNFGRIVFTA